MGIKMLLGSIMLGAMHLINVANGAREDKINFADPAVIKFIQDSRNIFLADNTKKGFIEIDGNEVKVIDDRSFRYMEGVFRFAFVNDGLAVNNDLEVVGKPPTAGQLDALGQVFENVEFGFQQNLQDAIADDFQTVVKVTNEEYENFDIDQFFENQFNQIKLYSAILAANPLVARGPLMFCLTDGQCRGNREDDKFGGTVVRTCNGLNEKGSAPECDSFVAFFSINWLFGWIIIVYIIILLWAAYMLYPKMRRALSKNKVDPKKDKGKPEYTPEQQLIINTLAGQCASAENLLLQASDMWKQAKNMETLISVEARRENRLMLLTVEFFQAMSAVMVSLTHQYLDQKTWTPGERFNDEDPATRALQLEVLNYCRERLQLAFQADALTEKSLLRIAEAYAILKRVSDSIVFVGFSCDQEIEDGIGNLRTPMVDLTENAFFLSGIFKGARGGLDRDIEGQEVSVPIKNTDARGLKEVGALYYLSDSSRDAQNFDPHLKTVTSKAGKTLVYSLTNAGSQGETLQYFVRTFWGPEIAAIQQEASSWLTNDTSLEAWIDAERLERERKAAPVVKRGAKKKRKNKKKHKKDKYQEFDETATEYTEYTEASGWSVASNNTYVFNVQSVVNQGLGIAAQPGMPFAKGGNIRQSSKSWKFFEKYFPNAAEWPKFYFIIFVLIPILIAIPMLAKTGKGNAAIDLDGNVAFKARAAGFGTSFLGVQVYYFLDGDIPEVDDLVKFDDALEDEDFGGDEQLAIEAILDQLDLEAGSDEGPFGKGNLFISNEDADRFFDEEFNGAFGRQPDLFIAEIQSGILVQPNEAALADIRNQQLANEFGTTLIYALMHNAAYFFGIVPLSLIRESLEILSRRFPFIRDIYPMSQWRDLHMNMGLAGIFYVTFGATVFLILMLVAMGRNTPFSGLSGDPNFANFFDLNDNVLYLRQLLLPAVPLLLLMKYAARGPPLWMQKYAPTVITKNYWEICYFFHYVVALTAIIMLVLYRPQVFYWMGATWGFLWGGNKIVRILRTRKTTIKNTNLISYSVEDKRNNAKKRTTVLRLTLNVPRSFPSSSRGQACWLTVPEIDYIAHPFTLAKVPSNDDMTIMFHIGIKFLAGDDIISYARPETSAVLVKDPAPPPSNPNALPPGWKSAVDPESGQTYYYNSAEKITTWERPKITAVDRMVEGARALTSRFSTNMIRGAGSTRLGQVNWDAAGNTNENRDFNTANRATWTQKLARMAHKLQTMDPDLRRNAMKDYPVYVSAPLGTSMDDCLMPSLPGSIIITTQNGLPAAESSVRWLLMQPKQHRPKFHFFVSVSREVNDALSVVETLRDTICDSVVAGHIDIDGLHTRHAHMADWLGVYIHLTRRKASQIEGDRDMLMKSLNPPSAPVTPQQLEVIETWLKNRVSAGRLDFERFLQRTSQMVKKRTGLDRIAVGYCGSAKIAYAIRAAAREIPNMTFDGEYI